MTMADPNDEETLIAAVTRVRLGGAETVAACHEALVGEFNELLHFIRWWKEQRRAPCKYRAHRIPPRAAEIEWSSAQIPGSFSKTQCGEIDHKAGEKLIHNQIRDFTICFAISL